MQEFEIIFYDAKNGTEPAKEFILSLDKKMQAKVLRTITILSANGPALREPCSKPIGDGIFELRAKVGSDVSRILYFFFLNRRIILTNGFIKKTPKTPTAEIEKAKRYRTEFLNRKENQQ